MKRLIQLSTFAALCALAACSSTSSTSGTTNTNTNTADVKTTTDAAGTGTGDTASNVADTTKTDTTTTDIKKIDTAPKDTGPTLCAPTDNTCITDCSNVNCATQQKVCSDDKSCGDFLKCINGCAQTPAVSPPDSVTGTTCEDKCVTLAKEVTGTIDKYSDVITCMYGQCIQCDSSTKDYDQCVNLCAEGRCQDELHGCTGNANCMAFIDCLNNDCGSLTDQTAFQACAKAKCLPNLDAGGSAAYQTFASCAQGSSSDCQ